MNLNEQLAKLYSAKALLFEIQTALLFDQTDTTDVTDNSYITALAARKAIDEVTHIILVKQGQR